MVLEYYTWDISFKKLTMDNNNTIDEKRKIISSYCFFLYSMYKMNMAHKSSLAPPLFIEVPEK